MSRIILLQQRYTATFSLYIFSQSISDHGDRGNTLIIISYPTAKTSPQRSTANKKPPSLATDNRRVDFRLKSYPAREQNRPTHYRSASLLTTSTITDDFIVRRSRYWPVRQMSLVPEGGHCCNNVIGIISQAACV